VTAVQVPAGTVTFLLTDVEGSTRLWSTEPERMRDGISQHYEILEEVIAGHGGVRPVEQGEGDSVVAAFSRPSDAVAAAIEAQVRLLAALDWLPVRMAVHTGEAILRGDHNYVGPSIIACARIRACAHGRQVVVSDATAALVAGRFTFADLGRVHLKGIVEPERVWQVTDPALPFIFPPLRGLDEAPDNLPTAVTSLVGRTDELAQVHAIVDRNRLTTLTGAGGCGKTRLALAMATATLGTHAGGSWWIELATTSTDDQVANTIAVALRVPLVAGTDPVGQVANHLRHIGSAMLILDNAEHVLDAVARIVSAILGSCPDVTIVVTSRESLGVAGEEVWRTPSLSAAEAAALFVERASSVRSDLVFDDAVVEAICQRLDGIPLAIELAAARARSIPLDRIAEELSNVFRVLTGGARTAVARQQTLLASIAWSHDLLNPVEQAVLRRLSVFQAPFRLETAEAIAADGTTALAEDVLEAVAHLVDKSLVQFDPLTGRYRLLETVRQYCSDRLRDQSETESTRDRHAAFYGRYALQISGRLRGLVLPANLRLDLPDLFAALRWAYHASPIHAYRICSMNRMARLAIGYLDELAEQLEWLVARDGHDAPAEWAAAMVHLSQEAIAILDRFDLLAVLPSFASFIDPDDADSRYWQLYSEGFAALRTGDTRSMQTALDAASETRRDATGAIASASFLAMVTAWTGRLDLTESSLAHVRRYLSDLDQTLTCDTSGFGHCAAIYSAAWQGRLDEARTFVQTELPNNAFTLFLSALALAWLGFASSDDEVISIAQRWIDRPAPRIQSGAATLVAIMTSTEKRRPTDLASVRSWFETLCRAAATSTSAFAAPLTAAYLAERDIPSARALAAEFRAASATMDDPPMHLAVHHQITAMIAYTEADRTGTATAARQLIAAASAGGYVLLQIDGLELLALSAALSAEDTASILSAAQASRDRIGYRGRWPSYGAAVVSATEISRRSQPVAYSHGESLLLNDACSLAL
jgi:predicted ATPase/class 3 adenylate cyclase